MGSANEVRPDAPGPNRPSPRRFARLGAAVAVAALGLAGPAAVDAAAPWWQLAGFPGQAVTGVAIVQGRLEVVVDGRAMAAGVSGFTSAPAPPPAPAAGVTAAGTTWSIDSAGRVLAARDGAPPGVDPGSPDLGAGAHLIAAPAALPGVVLAVSTGGRVWRRTAQGSWSLSLLLLPATLVTGTPAVTGIAAFSSRAVSGVVYLGTDGYGTLLTTDGGDDWVRADPGLPDAVLSLVADDSGSTPEVWAGTSQGLYVHRLQQLPTVPTYSGGSLTGKWLITVAACAAVTLLAALALLAWSRRRQGDKTAT